MSVVRPHARSFTDMDQKASGISPVLTVAHLSPSDLFCVYEELAQQVYRVAKVLSSSGVRFRSTLMTGGEQDDKQRRKSFRTQQTSLAEGVDVVVCTPGRLLEHLKKGNVELSECRAVVLDEADILCGESESNGFSIDWCCTSCKRIILVKTLSG